MNQFLMKLPSVTTLGAIGKKQNLVITIDIAYSVKQLNLKHAIRVEQDGRALQAVAPLKFA
ncbi:MAG: hypothetical protein QM730_25615 [Anaerolineales bacterium]